MQKNRILVGLVVLLAGVAWWAGVFDRNPSSFDLPRLEWEPGSLTRIEIARGAGAGIVLSSASGTWRLERPVDAAADSAAVGRLLRDLEGLELATLVSRNPERYGRFGVDSTAVEVVGTDPEGAGSDGTGPGRTVRIVVSERGPDYLSNYVRIADDPAVYSTSSRISIPTEMDRLRDRTVWTVDVSSVVAARVDVLNPLAAAADSPVSFDIRLEAPGWSLSEAGVRAPADSSAVTRWLDLFGALSADGFVGGLTPDSVRAAAWVDVSLESADGRERTITFAMNDDAVAAITSEGLDVYRFQRNRMSSLVPSPSSLRR